MIDSVTEMYLFLEGLTAKPIGIHSLSTFLSMYSMWKKRQRSDIIILLITIAYGIVDLSMWRVCFSISHNMHGSCTRI